MKAAARFAALEPIRKWEVGTCKNVIEDHRLAKVRFGVPWNETDLANFCLGLARNDAAINELPATLGAAPPRE